MERREFLKNTCLVCLAAGGGSSILSLVSCAALPAVNGDLVGGAVRIPVSAFSAGSMLIVQVPELPFDLALRRDGSGHFAAYLLRCTHADAQLTPSGDSFRCNLHGSRFDLDGKVRKGPASKDLERYPAVESDGMVIVTIPS